MPKKKVKKKVRKKIRWIRFIMTVSFLSIIYIILTYSEFSLRVKLNVMTEQVQKKNSEFKQAKAKWEQITSYEQISTAAKKRGLQSDFKNVKKLK